MSAADVFVSFAREDEPWVRGMLLPALEANDIRFTTLDDAPLGTPVLDAMSAAVEGSSRVLMVISPAFMVDLGQQLVSLLAQHFGMEHATWPVIPLVIRPTELPLRLRLLAPVEAVTTEQAVAAVDRICRDLGRSAVTRPEVPPCPYPGMRPYEESDRARFHGREEETDAALRMIRLSPALFVVGASGSGKSSLVRAGILPRLRESGTVPVLTRPGTDAVGSLARALAELDAVDGPRVLVVDQLEEVFTADARGGGVASAYWELLEPSLDEDTTLVATVRADFYPQLLASPFWPLVRDHRLELVPMDGSALRRAIAPPAQDVGVYIEAALVERLVADADRQPGALPFVQETLLLLWDRIEFRYLPLSAYQALVLPRGRYGDPPRTGLQVAMASRADAVMASLPSDDARRIARRVFLRLVQFGDGRSDTRRQQYLRALSSADDDRKLFTRTVDALVDARLLTATGDPGASTTLVDLSHEALIVGWPALQGWIGQRREAELRRRVLAGAAAEWDRLGRASGGLLDEVELHEAERWVESPDAVELGVERDIAELVAASRAAVDQAARRRRRTERTLRGLVASLAVLLVASLLLGWNARQQRDRAEFQRATAQSGELAVTASSLPPEHLDRALLLSQEAVRLRSTPRSLGSLLDALGTNPRVRRMVAFPDPLTAVAVSDDDRLVAVGDDAGTVVLLDAGTLEPVGPAQTVGGVVHDVAFAPGGQVVAASSSLGTVTQWSLDDAEVAPLSGLSFGDSVRALAYSGDGRWLAVGDAGGTVTLVDRASGEQTALAEHRELVNSVAFTADSSRLVTAGGRLEHASTDGRVLVWEVATGRLVTTLPDQGDAVRSIAVSPDDTTVAAAGADGEVRLWSLASGRVRTLSGHSDRVFGVVYSEDGGRVMSAGRDQTLRVWDVEDAAPALPPLHGHTTAARDLAVVPGADEVLSIGGDARLVRWDIGTAQGPTRLGSRAPGADRPVRAVATSPDGALVATGDDDGTVTVRRIAGGPPVWSVDTGVQPVWGLAFRPDGALAVVSSTGDLAVHRAEDGVRVAGPVTTGDRAPVVEVSADGGLVAMGGDDGVVRLFDPALRPLARSDSAHEGRIIGLAFTSDSRLLSVSAGDRTVWSWTVARSGASATITGSMLLMGDPALTSWATSADGHLLVLGDADGGVTLWDVRSSAEARMVGPALAGHEAPVTALGVTADGTMLVSADSEGAVRAWALGDGGGQEVGVLGSAAAARSGAVSGGLFVEGTDSGVVLWPVDVETWRAVACEVAGRNLRQEELGLYLGLDTRRRTCAGLPAAPPSRTPGADSE